MISVIILSVTVLITLSLCAFFVFYSQCFNAHVLLYSRGFARDEGIQTPFLSLAPPPPYLKQATWKSFSAPSLLRVIFLDSSRATRWRHRHSPLGATFGGECNYRIEVTWTARWWPGRTEQAIMQRLGVTAFLSYRPGEKAGSPQWKTS